VFLTTLPLRAEIDPGTPLLLLDQPVHLSRKAHNPIVNRVGFPRISGVDLRINGVRSVRTALIKKGFQHTL